MNYRHIYHAGNFADIVKHLCLISIINKLKLKEKPFCALDAFAGIGFYNLKDERAERTNEAKEGILKLSAYKAKLPSLVEQYLNIIKKYNSTDTVIYPGSPAIISDLLREHDRLIASELHKEDFVELKHNFHDDKNIKLHNIDAYQALKAFMPPLENRGLVFLDPPFEKIDEFKKIITASKLLRKHFLAGILLVWFPIKDYTVIKRFHNDFLSVGYKESIIVEFSMPKISASLENENKLSRTGLLIANPPWKLKEDLDESFSFLGNKIFPGAKFTIVD